jgi:hypothetical protein
MNAVILLDEFKNFREEELEFKFEEISTLVTFFNMRLGLVSENESFSESLYYHRSIYKNIFEKTMNLFKEKFNFYGETNSSIDDTTIVRFKESCHALGMALNKLKGSEDNLENTIHYKSLVFMSYCGFFKNKNLNQFYSKNTILGTSVFE